MELQIINRKEDPLLSRIRIESRVVFEKAIPSREEIKRELVKALGKDEKLIVVKGIYTSYGLKKAKNIAYVYENEEVLKRVEIKDKKATGEKKKAVEAKEQTKEKPQETMEEPKKAKLGKTEGKEQKELEKE